MRAILPVLLDLTVPAFTAEDPVPVVPKKKLSAISLLPDGSELHGVMFPRYDKDQRLIGVLKARAMTLVNSETIAGDDVRVEFFNPDQSPRGEVNLNHAVFDQTMGILSAQEHVTLRSDRINAVGKGLTYAFEQGQGFLTGPAITWMQAPTETAMNTHAHPVHAAAMLGISLIAQPLAAVAADVAEPAGAPLQQQTASARKELLDDLDASAAATRAAKEFLEKANIISKAATDPVPAVPEAEPLDITPGPTDTVITCEGGMYFNADKGLFVYLKNVRVSDPRFTLTGANELKIQLTRKPDKPADAKADQPADRKRTGLGMGAKFGEVESIIATGAVRITQKETEKGKEPVQASGAIFTYHPATGEIVLTGGYPWVLQGSTFMRAKEPNLTLRIQKSGSFSTEGNWEMGGNLQKPGKKPN